MDLELVQRPFVVLGKFNAGSTFAVGEAPEQCGLSCGAISIEIPDIIGSVGCLKDDVIDWAFVGCDDFECQMPGIG